MARVRATCNNCGDTELSIDDVKVRICREDHDGVYTFTCPECGLYHEKEELRRTLDLLVASGSEVVFWSKPLGDVAPSDLMDLTESAILDIVIEMNDDKTFEEMHRRALEDWSN